MRHIQSWEVCCLVWENIVSAHSNLPHQRGSRLCAKAAGPR